MLAFRISSILFINRRFSILTFRPMDRVWNSEKIDTKMMRFNIYFNLFSTRWRVTIVMRLEESKLDFNVDVETRTRRIRQWFDQNTLLFSDIKSLNICRLDVGSCEELRDNDCELKWNKIYVLMFNYRRVRWKREWEKCRSCDVSIHFENGFDQVVFQA